MELPGMQLEHGYVAHGHSNLGHSTTALGTMGHGHLDPLHSHPHHQSTAIIHHALINSHGATITNEEAKKKSKCKIHYYKVGVTCPTPSPLPPHTVLESKNNTNAGRHFLPYFENLEHRHRRDTARRKLQRI